MLPKDFNLHENRLSKESLESIEFQFDRLGKDSRDINVFLKKFTRISKSTALPSDDYEIVYLAAKIAYMLSDYAYFESEGFKEKEMGNDGARIWQALAKAAQGDIDESIKMLEDIKKITENSGDILQYIETLGILGQILIVRGSKDQAHLDKIMESIDKFEEKYKHSLPDFNHIFMPAYLLKGRFMTLQLSPKELIEEIQITYKIAEEIDNAYWMAQLQLDLTMGYLSLNDASEANNYLKLVFETLKEKRFLALEAKAIRIQGELFEKQNKTELAEKNYLKAKIAYTKLKDQIGVSTCVSKLANLAFNQNQQDKAEQYYTESYAISEKTSDFYAMTVSLNALARFASIKGQYAESLATYKRALEIAKENSFEVLLPSIYSGLAFVNFISGDFWSAVENRSKVVIFKEKMNASEEELLLEHMKLGQLNAIVGNLDAAFDEFEQALNFCMKLGKKDDLYFDLLNWLFEISTALGNLSLAETYVSRADLFASIHNSEEENVQALISRIRFLIQKREITKADSYLESVFEKALEFPSALTMALAIVEKTNVLLLQYQEKADESLFEEAMGKMEDMVFISLDLEFLPLTMYAKRALAKALAYGNKYQDGIEEIDEACLLAEQLGMEKFAETMKADQDDLKKNMKKIDSMSEKALEEKRQSYLTDVFAILTQTFWLVSASEHQQI